MSLAKEIGEHFRDKDKLVQQVSRHLMKPPASNGRRTGYVHPSALSSEYFCPRQAYYDITGVEADPQVRNLAFEMVFERGHDSHDKWQTWLWEMGLLRGMWQCLWCRLYWEDHSPRTCPRCESGMDLIRYREVPVVNEEFGIQGQADGDVWWTDHWTLIEVKTIGIGTIRWDYPQLLEKHTQGRTVDIDGLWNGIRRPFPAHLRQGMTYCFCADRKEMVFLYDPKFLTKYPKEFEIKFRRDMIEDRLSLCLIVKDHLEKQRAPKRPHWAEKSHRACKDCLFKSTCYGPR